MRLTLLLLGLVGSVGCVTTPTDDDDATEVDADGPVQQPLTCGPVDVAVSADPEGGSLVETEHYQLHVRGLDGEEAAELGRLAELAWSGWQAYFPSPIEANDPLVAYVEADGDAFRARLQADGLDPDAAGDAGGYYHPSTRSAYLSVQPTVWYTRVLFLHEIAHQAHDASRAGTGLPGWYVEGLAEFISRHDDDGVCLRLGVNPHLSIEDPAADALDAVDTVDLGAWFDQEVWPGRPLAMAFFRLLETERDLAPRWQELRAVMDEEGALGSAQVEEVLGVDIPALEERLAAFVAGDQEPMVPVYLEWLHRTPTSVRGWADGLITVARHKAPPDAVTLRSEGPSSGAVGLLLSWDSGQDYDALVLNGAGELWTFNAVAGTNTWNYVDTVAAPGPAVAWELTHEGTEAVVTVDGAMVRVPIGATPAVGLAVEDDDVLFSELSWMP